MHPTPERFHGLDALRAFALLLGVVFHSTLAHVLPPGAWAVGTASPSLPLGWFACYTHCFRMEVFFLLAGFFAALVISRRGTGAFLRDRAWRIALVFVVFLYPMKFVLTTLWMLGGRRTGWLVLPPEIAAKPAWQMALGTLSSERASNLQLTHLWFLYYLACVTVLFLALRWAVGCLPGGKTTVADRFHRGFRWLLSNWFAPLPLALLATPLVALMKGPDVDTPDRGLSWNGPVLALYSLHFGLGWWLFRNPDILAGLARRWWMFLLLGLAASAPTSLGVGALYGYLSSGTAPVAAVKWLTASGVSLTMMGSVLGWIGCFVRFFNRPSARIRYVANASYWIYLAHLPVVVALQIVGASWRWPWWIELPLLNVVAFLLLFASYHVGVRFTWVGAWLNGHRHERGHRSGGASPPPAPLDAPSRPTP